MLIDLEELVLQCRDERARLYIREAVACYQGRAYRSAIVATWIAVAFDIIDKMRELSLSGDKEAIKQIAAFNAMRERNDISASLTFERSLLGLAMDKFELISPVEHIDLERLQSDRNRCAHPSMASEAEIFSPSAELARSHIRSAVQHLLRHEPAQGKAALASLLAEIDSPYFPVKVEDVKAVLENGPLRRARSSLVRNFLISVIKKVLDTTTDSKQVIRLQRIFLVVKDMHIGVWNQVGSADLSRLLRAQTTPEQLSQAIHLAMIDPAIWEWLDKSEQVRFELYVQNAPSDELHRIEEWLSFAPLRAPALRRLKAMTHAEFNGWYFIFDDKQGDLRQEVIDRYVNVQNYDSANSWGKIVSEGMSSFTIKDVTRIFEAAQQNVDIHGSFYWPSLANQLKNNKSINDETFNEIVVRYGFDKFTRDQ